jgi:hypothetical protein
VTVLYQDIKEELELKNNALCLSGRPFTGMLKKQLDDEICEVNYYYGQIHGVYKCFFANGRIKEISLYKNGILDGRCIAYWPNGQKRMNVTYFEGKMDGLYEEWNEIGVLVYRKTYFKGKLIAIKDCSSL